MPAFAPFFALLRIVIILAIVLLVASVIYFQHRNQELERNSQHLKTSLDELQKQCDFWTEAFATTVHELRAPLTSIRGALVLLSAGALDSLDDRSANLIRIATANTGRLVHLVDELLELERIGSGAAPLELHTCSLDTVVAHAIESMSPVAQESAIELHLAPFPDTPLLFSGNALRMEQVLCNLLSNAIKFSSHGSFVTLSIRAEPYHLVLRVQDEGRGVPANKLEVIFDRFVRVDPPLSSNTRYQTRSLSSPSGSGLGLAISRSLVTQHGGTLHAERNDSIRPGLNGTTFVLRLPRLLTDATPNHKTSAHIETHSPSETIPDGFEQNRTVETAQS